MDRLKKTVTDFGDLLGRNLDVETMLARGAAILADLVAHDDWLLSKFAVPHPQHYQQYLLFCDPDERFSIVSFVWGEGQSTPVHDHTVWGLIGMLRGGEKSEHFSKAVGDRGLENLGSKLLFPGEVDVISEKTGDIHRVSNAYSDRTSISIHIYGGNIGKTRRHVYDPLSGARSEFVSGYANP